MREKEYREKKYQEVGLRQNENGRIISCNFWTIISSFKV
jgi:hypothetical protein